MHCTLFVSDALIEFPQKEIKDTEKTGERFAAAGRGREKDRFAIKDRRDAAQLRIGKIGIGRAKPLREARMQSTE